MKKDLVFVGIQFILFALYFIDWNVFQWIAPIWLHGTSIVILVIGLLIILFGILHLNENLSVFPSPKKGGSLMSKGIYAYVRHPIYLGIMISMTAYSVYAVSPIKFLITGIMIVLLYFKSSFEEQQLIAQFSDYESYQKSTGRFLPNRR